jgi:MoxR-like ATPase
VSLDDQPAGQAVTSVSNADQQPGWWLFRGTGRPLDTEERDRRWPEPPPWRDFHGGPDLPPPPVDEPELKRRLGTAAPSMLDPSLVSLVNAAIYLRRPLLITGRPGSGKSTLAYLITRELQLGRVLRWPITSHTTLGDGLFEYDAMGRAQATIQLRGMAGLRWPGRGRHDEGGEGEGTRRIGVSAVAVGDFVRLGPLGTALLPHRRPRVLLVDEVDKSDFDFPNDLLNVFEDGEFTIPELARVRSQLAEVEVFTADPGCVAVVRDGTVRCHEFPIVVITSNGERDFPAAFLRRCTRLEMPDPDTERLAALVAAHFPADAAGYRDLIARFERRRDQVGALAADQLLNAAYLAVSGASTDDEVAWSQLLDAVWHRLTPAPGL